MGASAIHAKYKASWAFRACNALVTHPYAMNIIIKDMQLS